MKYIILLSALCLPLVLTAEQYFKVSVGNADPSTDGVLARNLGANTSLDDSIATAIEWGGTIDENLSIGLEYSFYETDASVSGILPADNVFVLGGVLNPGQNSIKEHYDVDLFTLKLNYEANLSERFVLYTTSGLGIMKVEQTLSGTSAGESGSYSADDSVLALQIGAGLGYKLSDAVTLYAGVRQLIADDVELKYDGVAFVDGDADATIYELSMKYSF